MEILEYEKNTMKKNSRKFYFPAGFYCKNKFTIRSAPCGK